MKRLMACIVVLNILIVGVWVYCSGNYGVAARDEVTGQMISQNKPADTVDALYRLIYTNPDAAATLFYNPSTTFTGADIVQTYGDGSELSLEKIVSFTSGSKRDFAVVGTVLRVEYEGQSQVLLEAITLQRVNNKWYIIGDDSIPSNETYLLIYDMAYEVGAEIYAANIEGLNPEEAASIQEQAAGFVVNLSSARESIIAELN